MGGEQHKALVRRYVEEVINRHDVGALDTFVSPDIRLFLQGRPAQLPGIAGHRALLGELFSGFPELRLAVVATVAEGDHVMFTWTAEATHAGPFAGLAPTQRTHRPVGADYVRIADGKIVELAIYSNLAHLLGLPAG